MTSLCKLYYEAEMLNGRAKIFTNFQEVTDDNIGLILAQAYPLFLQNATDIEYLENYYRGIQPIKNRVKKIRPEICNKTVVNHAYEIANFRIGYLLEKPIQYVARKDTTKIDMLNSYNDFNEYEDKESKDLEIENHRAIGGTAYRLVLPNNNYDSNSGYDESPFNISTIDAKEAFVVYSANIGKKPLLGVIVLIERIDNKRVIKLQAWTDTKYYVYDFSNKIMESIEAHTYGMIPLIEYPNNEERMGVFEPVLDILDSANTVLNNAVDGIEQFIQAIMVFKNVEVTEQMLKELKELGAINISDTGEIKANVDYLSKELNQEQTIKLYECLISCAYKIAGCPQQKGSGGGNNGSTEMHDGWTEVQAKVVKDEAQFRKSEKKFIKLSLNITKTLTLGKVALSCADITIKFTRRNYENLPQKVDALVKVLGTDKVAPEIAFAICGLFADPEEAYLASKKYIEELEKKAQKGVDTDVTA